MMRGLIAKALRETFWVTVVFALGLAVVEGLLAYAFPSVIQPYAEQFLQMKFIQPFITGLLGEEIGAAFEPDTITTLAWVDPVVFTVLWAHAIWFASRVPAGEIDRGTADILLGLPVSRSRVLVADTWVLAASGFVVVGGGLVGNVTATYLVGLSAREAAHTGLTIAANLYCAYLAVAGMVYAASAISDRRGRAVGAALAVVISSFLIGFLAQLWAPMRHVRWLGILHYYRPLVIVRDDVWPVGDMVVLVLAGFAFWLVGIAAFARRDVRVG